MKKLITYNFILMSVFMVHSYASQDEKEDDKSSYSYRSTTKEISKTPVNINFSASKTPVSISGGGLSYKTTDTTEVSPKDEIVTSSPSNVTTSNDKCTAF